MSGRALLLMLFSLSALAQTLDPAAVVSRLPAQIHWGR